MWVGTPLAPDDFPEPNLTPILPEYRRHRQRVCTCDHHRSAQKIRCLMLAGNTWRVLRQRMRMTNPQLAQKIRYVFGR
jgi:hypothetical protein